MSGVMTPEIAAVVDGLRAEYRELVDRAEQIDAALAALDALYGFTVPAGSNGHKPKAPAEPARKPRSGRGTRWSDEGIRDLIADVDFAAGQSITGQLVAAGVARGTVSRLLARARKLGLLDGLDPGRTPARRVLDEAWLRATWATLDPARSIRSQLVALGLSGSVAFRKKAEAEALGLTPGAPQDLGGRETHDTPASSPPPAPREQPAGEMACTSCEFTTGSTIDMVQHANRAHKRSATKAELHPEAAVPA